MSFVAIFASGFYAVSKSCKNIHVRDLLKMIPEDQLASIIEWTNVDHQVKKLFARTMFFLLLYGLIEGKKFSLRSLERAFKSKKFKALFNIDSLQSIRYNSLSNRLSTMNVEFFRETYELMYEKLSTYYNESELHSYNIVRVDSTMVAEAANKLEKGMITRNQTQKKSTQVKYTMSMTNFLPSGGEVFTDQSALNESITIPQVIKSYIHKKDNNVFVFDRGVKSRKVFNELDEELLFVTRITPGSRYEVVESFNLEDNIKVGNLAVKSDDSVYLFDRSKNRSNPFRLIQTHDEKGKELWFVTNLLEDSVGTIIEIYKKRWDIEVFFRFIKQELNFSHLISTKENGMKIMLYMTMIAAMLILVYKRANNMGYREALDELYFDLEEIYAELLIKGLGGDPSLVFR